MFVRRVVFAMVLAVFGYSLAWPQYIHSGSSQGRVLSAQTAPYGFADAADMPQITDIFAQVNAERARVGRAPLTADPVLTELAQARAASMTTHHYYGHHDPSGNTFGDMLRASGSSITYGCENLDLQFVTDPSKYVSDWMNSTKGHRECLLQDRASRAGYAVTEIAPFGGESVKTYVVVAIHATMPIKR